MRGQTGLLDGAHELPQLLQAGARGRVGEGALCGRPKRAGAMQAWQLGQCAECRAAKAVCLGATRELWHVSDAQGLHDIGARLRREAAQQRCRDTRVAEVDREILEPGAPDRGRRHAEHFEICFDTPEADQLDPRLRDLALTTSPLPLPPQDRALIAETRGAWHVGEARPDEARNLRGDVRAQRHDGAGLWLDEAQKLVFYLRTKSALEHRRVLEDGQGHELVAVKGLSRQEIAHAGG